jgi:cell filamentation protein
VADDAGNRDDALARQLARFYAEYNYVHPFREGNGRTGTLVLHIVSTLRGRRHDLARRVVFRIARQHAASPRRQGRSPVVRAVTPAGARLVS